MDDCNKRIESLEQAKYSLQMHLESKDHMEKHYEAELSNASDRTKREVDAITERLQMTHANELQKLKSSNDSLKADLDLVKLKETQLQEKIQCLEERLEQADIGQNRTLMNMTTNMEDQVATLVEQTTQLEVDKLLLMDKLTESEEICKQQEMTISSSNKRLEELQEIADDRHQQCVSYQRAIEECRERLEEKQAELELFRLESQDPNRKGNSLFAEVEVKRHEIEKKYISLSVQYESAKKRANFHKHRIQELKLQVVNLLQTDDGRVSVNQVKEVQQALVRTRQQNQTLLQKLNESEGTKSAKMPQPHQTDKPVEENNTSEGGLAFLLEQAKKGSEKLRKELKTERMMRMTSETKESEYQVRLNDLKKELDKSKVVNLKMELKISDLREKVKMKGNEGLQTAAKVIKGGNLEKVAIAKRPPVSEVNDDQTDKENIKSKQ
ncbi:hypothetical protein BSL78_00287 [Apostichopus japonicus]|uniref:Uncharacterized protein n=1 Tax=Stichopus japonicus TaxID=307972 RepID=A0A2G8LRD7_STIJA|nr:hypothetical protein BSL78_00287 [Apostichopus japonicus]